MNPYVDESNLDEITFEKRNKDYGAYELRKTYKRNVTVALFVAIGFLSISVGAPFILANISKNGKFIFTDDVIATLDPYKVPDEIIIPPPLPPPIDVKPERIPTFVAPVIVDEDEIETTMETNEDLLTQITIQKVEDTPGEILVEKNPESEVTENTAPPVFYSVEEMPAFPGGDSALLHFISSRVKYSQEARELGIKGRVYVEFLVSSSGKVEQVHLKRGIDPLIDKEALKVIEQLPDWTPGKQAGHAVNVMCVVPINFKLE